MFSLVVTCLTLAWISVVVRFGAKAFLVKYVGWNDWILLLAVIMFTGQCGCLVMTNIASPHPVKMDARTQIYMTLASTDLSLMTSIALKSSLAIGLVRFFSLAWQRWTIVIVTILFSLYAAIVVVFTLLFCGSPSIYAQKQTIEQCTRGKDMLVVNQFTGIFNAVTDWVYILLPIIVVWQSNLTRKTKASISIITAVASVGGAAAIARAVEWGSFNYVHHLSSRNLTALRSAIIELGFGIIAASMTGATQIPGRITRTTSAQIEGKKNAVPEDDEINVIKLSPIICQQKAFEGTISKNSFAAPEPEALAAPAPTARRKSNRFSWSRSFGQPGSSISMPGNIVLLIDDISDEEDEGLADKNQNTKRPYSNV